MIKFWRKYLIIFSIAALAGGVLLKVSQSVELKQRELRQVELALEAEREKLQALRAEWAYLNRPDYLEELAARHLKLLSPASKQVKLYNKKHKAQPISAVFIEPQEQETEAGHVQ